MTPQEVWEHNNKSSHNGVHLLFAGCHFNEPRPQSREVCTRIIPILQVRQWRHNREQSHKCKEVNMVEGRLGAQVVEPLTWLRS